MTPPRCPHRTCLAAWLALASAWSWPPACAQDTDEALSERSAPRAWDAAVGFIVSHGPSYPGSDRTAVHVAPGLAVRWGRFSLASRSAFSVRGVEAGAGAGLRVELARTERLRAGLALRLDSGRKESDSPELRGLGDIRSTLRLRLSASLRLDDGWRVRLATTADALGRDGGLQAELQLSRDLQLAPALSLNSAVSLGWADRRHLQSYFGVTHEQAGRSGYPHTALSSGLRDLTLSAGLRQALGPDWAVFGNASASRLLDQAAASPLTRQRDGWGLGLGLVYRF